MLKFTVVVTKNIFKILIVHQIFVNVGIFLVLYMCKIRETEAFPSGVHVDGYEEMDEPIYPFQQYIQVRKTYTVEHVPVYDDDHSSSQPHTAASNRHHGSGSDRDHHHQAASTIDSGEHGHSDGNHYYTPRLREEIDNYKKQEVYEEKGYGDSGYDHYKEPSIDHHYHDHNSEGTSPVDSSRSASNNVHGNGRRPSRYPSRHSLHTPDGQSTKILEYASTLHDSDAQQKGIYTARSNIYCPEVIDFDLSSKSMAMGKGVDRKAKPRLHGLGSKISCLKNKYFGSEPLPKAIFAEPSESKHSVIETPSMESFFKMIQHNAHSSSTFQNSRVPI